MAYLNMPGDGYASSVVDRAVVRRMCIKCKSHDKLHADLKTARDWGRAASDSNKVLRDRIKMLEADRVYFLRRSLDAERELNLHKLFCEVYSG